MNTDSQLIADRKLIAEGLIDESIAPSMAAALTAKAERDYRARAAKAGGVGVGRALE